MKNEKTPRKNIDKASRNNGEISRTMTQGSRSHITNDGHRRELYTDKHKCDGNTWKHMWTAKKMNAVDEKKWRSTVNKHENPVRSSRVKPAKRNLETFEAIVGENNGSDGGKSAR